MLSWAGIFQIALSAGIVSALINQSLTWIREARRVRRAEQLDATYLALRLAVIMESFCLACVSVIEDNELHDSSDGQAGNNVIQLPTLLEYPNDANWISLDPELTARALAFRNELWLSDVAIRTKADVSILEDAVFDTNRYASKDGLRAWKLACDLRKRYRLPKFDPAACSWDVITWLETKYTRYNKKQV